MKNNKNRNEKRTLGKGRTPLLALLIAICYMLFGISCDNIIDTQRVGGMGAVIIGFTLGGEEIASSGVTPLGVTARTIFPLPDKFDEYEYAYFFTKQGNPPNTTEPQYPEADGSFILETGTYTVMVRAYGDSGTQFAASGTSAAFTVALNAVTPVTVGLAAEAGQGDFAFAVRHPDDVTLALSLRKYGASYYIDLTPSAVTDDGFVTVSGSMELEAGTYTFTINLSRSGETAGISESIYIAPFLTTEYGTADTPIAFTHDDLIPSTVDILSIPGVTPVIGAVPAANVSTDQYSGTVAWNPSHAAFALGETYEAVITLTANAGYTFYGVEADAFTVAGAASVANAVDSGTVTASFAALSYVVNIPAIVGVTPPAHGGTPVTAIAATDEYTGTVAWEPDHATFQRGTAYTATITLTAIGGYTLNGVAEDFFTVAGATATNAASSGVITAAFPQLMYPVTIYAIAGVTVPAIDGVPVTSITETDQYTGTVAWQPDDAIFAVGETYTATITLTPKTGFTLQGVEANFFTVAGTSTAATNAANSGVITAVFPLVRDNEIDIGDSIYTGATDAATATNIANAILANPTWPVVGTRSIGTATLVLEIPTGTTINWDATLTGNANGNSVLSLTGEGELHIRSGGVANTNTSFGSAGWAIMNSGTGILRISQDTTTPTIVTSASDINNTGTIVHASTLVMTGGTVSNTGWGNNTIAISNLATGTVNISGGTVSSPNRFTAIRSLGGTITISGGTITAGGVANDSGGITSGTIRLENVTDSTDATRLVISGGTVTNTHTLGSAIYNDSNDRVELRGGSITSPITLNAIAGANPRSGSISIGNADGLASFTRLRLMSSTAISDLATTQSRWENRSVVKAIAGYTLNATNIATISGKTRFAIWDADMNGGEGGIAEQDLAASDYLIADSGADIGRLIENVIDIGNTTLYPNAAAIATAIQNSPGLRVIGTRDIGTSTLTLNIPAGAVINWTATLTGSSTATPTLDLTGVGELHIRSGGVTNASTGIAIRNSSTGLLRISQDSGTTLITSANQTAAAGTILLAASGTETEPRLIMTGGTVRNTALSADARAINNLSTGEVQINGGTVGATDFLGVAIHTSSSGNIRISGTGTIITSANVSGATIRLSNLNTDRLVVSGGTVSNTANSVNAVAISNDAYNPNPPNTFPINISGGTVSTTGGGTTIQGRTAVNGGTVSATGGGTAIRGVATVSSGTVRATGGGTAIRGDATVTGGTVSSDTGTAINGDATISGTALVTSGVTGHYVGTIQSTWRTRIQGGTIRNTAGGTAIRSERILQLEGGTIDGALRLVATSNTIFSQIEIHTGWTGTVGTRLEFAFTGTNSSSSWWSGRRFMVDSNGTSTGLPTDISSLLPTTINIVGEDNNTSTDSRNRVITTGTSRGMLTN